jgi:hypothetical protein
MAQPFAGSNIVICVIVTGRPAVKVGKAKVSNGGCVAVGGRDAVGVSVGTAVGVDVAISGVLLGAGVSVGMVVDTMVVEPFSGSIAISL